MGAIQENTKIKIDKYNYKILKIHLYVIRKQSKIKTMIKIIRKSKNEEHATNG